jgi:hypothetical protein
MIDDRQAGVEVADLGSGTRRFEAHRCVTKGVFGNLLQTVKLLLE